MPQLRLLGLILFITTLFLSLAAAATQTKQLRFSLPNGQRPTVDAGEASSLDPALPRRDASAPPAHHQVEFYAVPIVWPLAICGGVGLLLWFGTAPRQNVKPARRRRKRRRK